MFSLLNALLAKWVIFRKKVLIKLLNILNNLSLKLDPKTKYLYYGMGNLVVT